MGGRHRSTWAPARGKPAELVIGASILTFALLASICPRPALAQPAALPPAVLPGTEDAEAAVFTAVIFEGNRALTDAELQGLAAPFLHRPIRLLDVEELRQRITRAYVARGHVNSGALLSDQALRGGTLHLQVIEGRVTTLRQRGLAGLSPDYLRSRLVRPDETLHLPQLQERFAALLEDPLIERLNARLVPGDALGASVLDLHVTRKRPWQFSLFAHNQGAPSVGSAVAGAELRLHNLSGWGDQLVGSLSRSRGGHQHDLSWTLPLAATPTLLQLRTARSATSVIEEPLAALDIASRVDTQEITLSHPVLDGAGRRVTLGLSHGLRDNRTTLDGQPFSFVAGEATGRVRVRAWRFFQDLSLRLDRQWLALRSTFAVGRNNLDGSAPLPGQPATHYRLWLGQALGTVVLGDQGAQLQLRATVQYSRDALVPLEQLAVGGRHTVRGYRENQLVRDNGWALSLEGHYPLLTGDGARRQLYLVPFVDAGAARNRGGDQQRLASAGLGLRARFDGLEAELFVARRLERRPVESQGDLQDHGIHLSMRWHAP
jgi:hemolysin activation/secretion protein